MMNERIKRERERDIERNEREGGWRGTSFRGRGRGQLSNLKM